MISATRLLPGNVGGGDDGELVPGDGRIEVDAEDAPARDLAAHRRAVEHAGQREVVDVARLPGDLVAPFTARNGPPDERSFHARRW